MNEGLPIVFIARHSETEWSVSGQHTGLTDLPLTKKGEADAALLSKRIKELKFDHVFASPLQRAARTCELCGYKSVATVDRDLVEWDYGDYEGLTSKEIREKAPEWQLFRDGCPNGESPSQIAARADRLIARLRQFETNSLIFTSGHIARVIALRWIGQELSAIGSHLMLGTASLSALSYERTKARPVIRLWNETRHLDIR